MKCEICKKEIITQEDWGDYDNAIEWACNHFNIKKEGEKK